MQARDIRIEGFDVFAQRVTYVGELGWEFYLEPSVAMQVWDRLIAAGQTVGIRPGGYRALDSLRMEKGYRYYGTDLTLLDNPLEAGLGFCVRFDKGDFNGREALIAAKAAGIKRRLRTLLVGERDYVTIYRWFPRRPDPQLRLWVHHPAQHRLQLPAGRTGTRNAGRGGRIRAACAG
jgi:4-methylaminobutanoate oxidase (formaldehyde-forming)